MTVAPHGRRQTLAGVLDQGLAAGAGFAGSIALARWLPRDEFGAYALALGLLAWLLAVHAALVTEPLLVFGPARHAARLGAYVRRVARLHILLTVVIGAVCAASAWLLRGPWAPARPVLAATALLFPALAAPHLGRRALYAAGRTDLAACASAVQCLGALAGLVGLQWTGRLTGITATAALAAAGLAAGLLAIALLPPGTDRTAPTDVWSTHAAFGRWGLLAAGLAWANANLAAMALPAGDGLAATGALRAATTLMAPMLQLNAALGVVLLPSLAALRARAPEAMADLVRQSLRRVVLLSSAFWLVLAVGSPWLTRLLYADRYPELPGLLVVIGLLPLTEGIGYIAGTALRSLERPADIVRAQFAAGVLVTVPGVALAITAGPMAAAGAMVLASGLAGTLLLFRVRTQFHRTAATAALEPT